jgi:ABC-type polysaccharide/polyol phosphate export permease
VKPNLSLSLMLAWQDIKQAYRRSSIGAFWITTSMAVQIATMGVVFGIIFKTPLFEYLPFLSTGVILWSWISSTVTESCNAFISAEAIIKQLSISQWIHVARVMFKNLITLAHNIVIIPLVFLVVWHPIGWQIFLLVPGLLLVLANLSWIGMLLGFMSARFRDVPQIASAAMTIVYFVTPVMWKPELIPPNTAHWLLGLNPFYHLVQLVRLPFLSTCPTPENWLLSLAFALCGWSLALLTVRKFGNQMAYWV